MPPLSTTSPRRGPKPWPDVSPDLPPALKAAIDRELEGAPRRDLAARTAATSRTYRSGGTSAAAIRSEADALAYALTRLPATYAAGVAVFDEVRRRAPGFSPESVLDAGAGPGGAGWAALQAWASLERVTRFDSNSAFLTLARRLAAEGPEPLRMAEDIRGDLTRADPPPADLVVASYALAEIPADSQPLVLSTLWAAARGLLVLIEPGTPAGFSRLLAARDALIGAEAQILAPCPHASSCPLQTPDWCHFSVRLPRSRDHRLAKGAAAPFEDEKFAYLVAARPQLAANPATARVLAPPRAGKPGIELKLCTSAGLSTRFVARRDKPAHAAARRLGWGDASES